MAVTFQSAIQEELFSLVVTELEALGYRGDLLAKDYLFPDYFEDGAPERRIEAAAFGQTPPSYKTACFGVLLAGQNGQPGTRSIESYRALGAPYLLEIHRDRVTHWLAGKDRAATRSKAEYGKSDLRSVFSQHADLWTPDSLLRAKNIGPMRGEHQLDFFDAGLIPALEEQIEEKLDPILKRALVAAQTAYSRTAGGSPDDRQLFRLAFRLLAGKIFHDRGVHGFHSFTTESGPDAVLQKVAQHYREQTPKLLNLSTREAAFRVIWSGLDFRNLSIDVLTGIWSRTLVTKKVRKALGIHTTPRSVTSYIVDRLPSESFQRLNETQGLVLEPCCGSATFLVEAMQRIRLELPRTLSAQQRHAYFQNVLAGIEMETFGVEIARLCLALADFPNPNGWMIYEKNVFTSKRLSQLLNRARVVLCNPPFQTLAVSDPLRDHIQSPHKPVEILLRVLQDLHPEGVLGFVLPRTFLDGARYQLVRQLLVSRFARLELVSLPDVAFRESEAQHETVLLLADSPQHNGQTSTVRHRRVAKDDWEKFKKLHRPTTDDVSAKTVEEAAKSLTVPLLSEVWSYLADLPKLGRMAKFGKGLDWNLRLVENGKETGNREKLVFDTPKPWTREGVPPLAKINCFQKPQTKYLSIRPEDQRRNAYQLPWHLPKVILNAARRSRGPWRISAFADSEGLTCYRTFLAVWPNDPSLTTVVAAILNGPVANAFSATREGLYIGLKGLKEVPFPAFSPSLRKKTEEAVGRYLRAVALREWDTADTALRWVDALVLKAYDLPPRLERKLLDYFCGAQRPVPFAFHDYFPAGHGSFVPLRLYLSSKYRRSTPQDILQNAPVVTDPELLEALREAE